MSGQAKFVHLHVKTCMSFHESIICIQPLVNDLRLRHFDACAVTDRGNVLAAESFCAEAVERGIKPIVGCEIDVYDDVYHGAGAPRPMGKARPLVLLVQNEEGWKSLCEILGESASAEAPWIAMRRLKFVT
ncbi:MAG: PHP domain-containing protein, partial [Deltaproteobacteria bacterium]|nr:PHP domain-containing protein [Deltaproteobacteria bacterium]